MNRLAAVLLVIAGPGLAIFLFARDRAAVNAVAKTRSPVLVELFTSEGCSSCPPADALLQKFDGQPFPDAELIVLSEHVDYWDHIGWKDPFSAAAYSERQSAYGNRLGLESVYTPQMIVDGVQELVGNSSKDAEKAIVRAAGANKVTITISGVTIDNHALRAHLETEELPSGTGRAEVVLAIALRHVESQVKAGENSGRRLTHVGVVRSLTKVGSIAAGQKFSSDVSAKLAEGMDGSGLRVIAFIQKPGPGKVLGAVSQDFTK
jgi:hypothetical protein